MNTKQTDWSLLLPFIENIMPNLIASQIVGVQPMTAGTGSIFDIKSIYGDAYKVVDKIEKDGELWYTIHCNGEVMRWLETQPKTYWSSEEHQAGIMVPRVDIHSKLYSMLAMTIEK